MIYVGHLSLIRERMGSGCVGLSHHSTSPPYLHEPSTVLSLCLISRLAEGRQKTMACIMAEVVGTWACHFTENVNRE